jgi:hypothetical protein
MSIPRSLRQLPRSDVLALAIIEGLEAALERFGEIMADLSGKKWYKYTSR